MQNEDVKQAVLCMNGKDLNLLKQILKTLNFKWMSGEPSDEKKLWDQYSRQYGLLKLVYVLDFQEKKFALMPMEQIPQEDKAEMFSIMMTPAGLMQYFGAVMV